MPASQHFEAPTWVTGNRCKARRSSQLICGVIKYGFFLLLFDVGLSFGHRKVRISAAAYKIALLFHQTYILSLLSGRTYSVLQYNEIWGAFSSFLICLLLFLINNNCRKKPKQLFSSFHFVLFYRNI